MGGNNFGPQERPSSTKNVLSHAGGDRTLVHQENIQLLTDGHCHMHDITNSVQEVVAHSSISTGIVHLFNVGSTAALGAIEFEPGLERDLPELLDRLVPPSRDYGHERAWHDGNGHSHLQATLLGPSLTVPVSNGRLVLGTWQQLFHLECDVKPRNRTVVVTVIGE
jgi:secondary thiamine-phosphate synthase enzyme